MTSETNPHRTRRWGLLVFCGVLFVHALSPVLTSGDSRWSVMVALSLIDRGTTNLDAYLDLIKQKNYFSVECVGPAGEIIGPQIGDCAGGHIYNWYPIGTPLLAAPFVWALRAVLQAAAPVLSQTPLVRIHPVITAFLTGDVVAGHPLAEAVVASIFAALTSLVLFLIARRFLPPRGAAAIAFIFAFATPAWSIASRSLQQHGPSMLLIAFTIYLLLRAADDERLVALAGLPVALSYVVRPTNSLLVLVVSVYILLQHRRQFTGYLLCALPVAAGFLAYNLSAFGGVLSSYYRISPPVPGSVSDVAAVLRVMTGHLISPSRGLLVFTPFLLVSIAGMVRCWREPWGSALWRYLAILVVLHWITISLYVPFWWGGHSYGPRFFTDMIPILVLFLIPVFQDWQTGGWNWRPAQSAFAVLLAASVFVHAQGGLNIRAQMWNVTPIDVDQDPDRVWDWKDPQFLRGLSRFQSLPVSRPRKPQMVELAGS